MMKYKSLLIVCLFVSFCLITPLFLTAPEAEAGITGHWWYVGGNGPGNYTTIQDAVDNASAGDTVFVYHGLYHERITVNTSIFLIAESRQAIIDGEGLGSCPVRIFADAVTFSGFTVLNNESDLAMGSILVEASDCHILNTFASSTSSGDYGILLISAEGVVVEGNTVNHHVFGIALFQANHCTVMNNTLTGDNEGIELYMSQDNLLQNNSITNNNEDGIIVFDSNTNTITGNEIKSSTRYGIFFQYLYNGSAGNVITKNTFQGNGHDAFFFNGQGKNTWQGNYWHRYLKVPKLIIGRRAVLTIPAVPFHFPGFTIFIPWVAIDWHPSKIPPA